MSAMFLYLATSVVNVSEILRRANHVYSFDSLPNQIKGPRRNKLHISVVVSGLQLNALSEICTSYF